MPSADSPARSLRVRSPMLARPARSAGRSRAAAGAAGRGDAVVMTVLPARAGGGRAARSQPRRRRPVAGDGAAVSAMMCPSSISMRRRVRAATAWSWVMMMTVVPGWLSSSSRARIAAPVAESRFPVGSSASTTGGAPATARAIATRCRSPPDSWVGRAAARCAEPDPVQRVRRQPPPLGRAGPRRTAARRPRCPARSGARRGRTAGTRTRSGTPAARPAPGRSSGPRPGR